MFLILSLYKVPNLMNSSGQIVLFFNSLFCQFSKRMYALRKRKYLPWKLSSESTTITSSFVSLRYVSTNRKHPRRRQISGDELDSCQRESVCIGGKREAEGIGSLDEALLKMEAESVARVQKQNQQKKKRGCTRGFPVAACQRYLRFGFGARFLCHLSLSLSLFLFLFLSLSLFLILFPSEAACARAHPCLSRDVYRSVGDNHRPRMRSLSHRSQLHKYRGRHGAEIIAIYFLTWTLLFSRPRISVSPDLWPSIAGCTAQVSRGRCHRRLILWWNRKLCA